MNDDNTKQNQPRDNVQDLYDDPFLDEDLKAEIAEALKSSPKFAERPDDIAE